MSSKDLATLSFSLAELFFKTPHNGISKDKQIRTKGGFAISNHQHDLG
jgi:hypothetical protein